MVDATVAEERRDFYVYVIFRPSGVPCYVGKGCGYRWNAHERKARNPHLAHIVKQGNGSLPKVIVRENLPETQAFETERALIAAIGRKARGGPLVNQTDGGEGVSGYVPSMENRQKKREANLGKKRSAATCAKIGDIHRGKKASPEACAKMGAARRGIKQSPETIAKRQAKLRGRKRTPEFCAAVSTRCLGKKLSPERCAAIGAIQRGTKHTPEHRAANGAARRGKKRTPEFCAAIRAAHAARRAAIAGPWLADPGPECHVRLERAQTAAWESRRETAEQLSLPL
jgi:hypothetical protein